MGRLGTGGYCNRQKVEGGGKMDGSMGEQEKKMGATNDKEQEDNSEGNQKGRQELLPKLFNIYFGPCSRTPFGTADGTESKDSYQALKLHNNQRKTSTEMQLFQPSASGQQKAMTSSALPEVAALPGSLR